MDTIDRKLDDTEKIKKKSWRTKECVESFAPTVK